MLRNLLYSIFFHIMFIALLFVSTAEFDAKIVSFEATPLTISFISDDTIDNIKDIKVKEENKKVKNLTLDEKIDLYNKIKNNKIIEAHKKKEANKVVYEKTTKKPIPTKKENSIPSDENEFSYYYTPVYVAEHKINTEEKRRLIENRLKREELRKKMKERNVVPQSIDTKKISNEETVDEIIKKSQKPLVVKKPEKKIDKSKKEEEKKEIKKIEEVKEENKEVIEEEYSATDSTTSNIDELITEISISDNEIDEKYKEIKEDEIFNEEDYKKLKELKENKADSKYILSLRENKNIQRQIKSCYKMAILRSKKDSKAVISLTVRVEKDGIINMNNIKVVKILDNSGTENSNIALDNAKSALVFCSPLRGLPAGKYKSWKQMTFVFDSNNLE